MEHWAKSFFEKITLKYLQNTFGHFWEWFWAFLEFWNFFDFFENFRRLDPPWNSGQKFFLKKSPQNIFKTRLDTFGNDFGHFCNFGKFLIFLKYFEDSTLHGTLGKKFFRKNHPKTSSKHVWTLLGTILGMFGFLKFFCFWKISFGHFWGRFWAFLEIWNFFDFFLKIFVWTLLGTILGIFGILKIFWFVWKFSMTRPSMEHWAKKFFEKITPKLVQNTLGHFLERFRAFLEFWNLFDFFWKFSKTRPTMEHWAKSFFEKITLKHLQNTFGHFWEWIWAFLEFWNFFDFFENFRRLDPPWNSGQKFFWKNRPKTFSKHVWTLLGTILGIFGILENSWFFWNISKTRPSMEHWAEKKFKKITLRHLQNTFGHFWERFWAFLEYWKFFDLFESFRWLDPPWNTGQKNLSKKSPLNLFKTRWDTFWNDFGHFWNFETFWAKIFWFFLKIFEDSTHHGTLGKKFFRKNHPKTSSKHVWTLLGMILGIFGILKFFLIFSKIFGDSTLHGTVGKNFFWKNRPKTFSKHVWTLLGTILGIFGILKIFDFFEIFEDSTLHGTLGKKFFRKNHPKTSSKHVWTLLGTILGMFGFLKFFCFWKISFGHFWGRFWAFLEIWNFFDFFWKFSFGHFWGRFWAFWNFENFLICLKVFDDSTLHGTLGKKFFRKNGPKLGTFWNDFGHFWNFENFLIFLKVFDDSTLHGTLGKKFFRKNHP